MVKNTASRAVEQDLFMLTYQNCKKVKPRIKGVNFELIKIMHRDVRGCREPVKEKYMQ